MGLNTNTSPRFTTLIFIIFLSVFHVSNSRHIPKETQSSSESSSWQYLANAPKGLSTDDHRAYWVSYRRVPAGPNPLHN
ncbi:unnamed protein product [Amaranthus hypochondriacus]